MPELQEFHIAIGMDNCKADLHSLLSDLRFDGKIVASKVRALKLEVLEIVNHQEKGFVSLRELPILFEFESSQIRRFRSGHMEPITLRIILGLRKCIQLEELSMTGLVPLPSTGAGNISSFPPIVLPCLRVLKIAWSFPGDGPTDINHFLTLLRLPSLEPLPCRVRREFYRYELRIWTIFFHGFIGILHEIMTLLKQLKIVSGKLDNRLIEALVWNPRKRIQTLCPNLLFLNFTKVKIWVSDEYAPDKLLRMIRSRITGHNLGSGDQRCATRLCDVKINKTRKWSKMQTKTLEELMKGVSLEVCE
ncbi:hypothetical protein M422DRAFT_257745 [Sphaerobolus stellatus SS14]|uniref:Uncharacterized protein n=1 Tax=Sphaerobolus stellatus (strain SS14) TaxID=990650 RepID=A0A0C9VDF1_SPHS4|nr:hypothetical protein M422DRAFT_257745 [Sphaerobolus stellatus SS14]